MSNSGVKLEKNDDGNMAYLFLPAHPGKGKPGIVIKQVSLHSVIPNYQGPEIFLGFDKDGVIIGMEFLLD